MGYVIKEPGSLAAEYSRFSFYGYYGCSNGCKYCYLTKGRFSKVLGVKTPTLKKSFKNIDDVLNKLSLDIESMKESLIENGVFFSFNTDPMLPDTFMLTVKAVDLLNKNGIPTMILSKRVDCYPIFFDFARLWAWDKSLIQLGQSITGFDELEPLSSPNQSRLNGLWNAKLEGFKTFASFEPVIKLFTSLKWIEKSLDSVDHYKIGLEKGKKFSKLDVTAFMEESFRMIDGAGHSVYYKNSITNITGYAPVNSIRF